MIREKCCTSSLKMRAQVLVHRQAMASALPSGMATPVEVSRATSLGSYLQLDDLHGPNGPHANFSSSADQPDHLFGSEAPHMGIPSFSNRPPSHLGPSRAPPEMEPAQRLPEPAASQPVFGYLHKPILSLPLLGQPTLSRFHFCFLYLLPK